MRNYTAPSSCGTCWKTSSSVSVGTPILNNRGSPWNRKATSQLQNKTKHPRVIWNPLKVIKSSGWNPNKTHTTFATIILGVGVLARSNLAPNLLSAQWPSSLGRDCANKTPGKGCHNMISPWCWQTWSRKWCYITNKLHTHTHMCKYIYIVNICTHDINDNNIWLIADTWLLWPIWDTLPNSSWFVNTCKYV